MRNVTIISNTTQRTEKVKSAAVTWGAFLEENSSIEDMAAGLKAVEKSTRAVLQRDTTIPDEEFTVYLFPNKIEAGL